MGLINGDVTLFSNIYDTLNGSKNIELLIFAHIYGYNITENPHKFEIIELEAAAIPRSLDDLTCAAINTTYALNAGLNPAKDPIVKETADSLYVNIVAVQEKDLKDPRLKVFQEAYQSKENADFIETKFPGSVYLGWKE